MTSETEMSIELLTGLHSEVGGNVCGYDDDPWPCDTGAVLMALATVQAELVEARDEYAEAYESGREAGDESGYEKCAEDRDAEIDALREQLAEARAERDAAVAAVAHAMKVGGEAREQLEKAAAFWRPVARDLEHGILSIDSVRFLAQDFLTMLAPAAAVAEGTGRDHE